MPDKDYLLDKYNKRYSTYTGKMYFTVFRIGDKFKNNSSGMNIDIKGLKGFQYHSNREGKVENADNEKSKDNIILIGNKNVEDTVLKYLEGVKIRENNVVARELVLSGGNGFYERMTSLQRKTWLDANVKFLKDNFGDNCVYSIAHYDETTVHIHALIVPKFWNEKRGLYVLDNGFYFNGKEKLSAWQDTYTNAMTENLNNVFMRGIRGSKAKHIDLQTYYNLINEKLDDKQAESIVAYAKENYLNKKKVEELQETLQSNEVTMEACNKIIKVNKELKESKKLYEYTIKTLAAKYKIPEKEVIKILDSKKAKDKQKDQRER